MLPKFIINFWSKLCYAIVSAFYVIIFFISLYCFFLGGCCSRLLINRVTLVENLELYFVSTLKLSFNQLGFSFHMCNQCSVYELIGYLLVFLICSWISVGMPCWVSHILSFSSGKNKFCYGFVKASIEAIGFHFSFFLIFKFWSLFTSTCICYISV